MKSIILILSLLFLLTGCPKEQEVRNMMDSLKEEKSQAASIIERRSFMLDDMLMLQEYFFHFGERVHLLKEDPETLKSIKYYIRKNGLSNFCSDFVLPVDAWRKLRSSCEDKGSNRCSSDISSYESTLKKLVSLLGPDTAQEMRGAAACN